MVRMFRFGGLSMLLAGSVTLNAATDRSNIGPSAACQAEAEVLRTWVEEGNHLKAKIKVVPSNCSGYCNGYVTVDFHWETASGKALRSSGEMEKWSVDTTRGKSTEVVTEEVASHILCPDKEPCKINDVAVRKVTCYD